MKNRSLLLPALITAIIVLGAGCTNPDGTTIIYAGDVANNTSSTDVLTDQDLTATVEPEQELVETKTGKVPTSTLSYAAALKIYQNLGARIQFANCSGNPGTMNIKKGTKFMIDNRDNESHKIGIGTKSYLLPGYNFAIVSVLKAGSYNITCDGGGSAHLGVQN